MDDGGDVGDADGAATFVPLGRVLHGRGFSGLHGGFEIPAEGIFGGDGAGSIGPGVLDGTALVAGYGLQHGGGRSFGRSFFVEVEDIQPT